MVAASLALLTTLVTLLTQTAAPSTQVRTANGVVAGATVADGRVRAFKGVPFAAPPVGDLRWKAPQPAAAWTGVRPATSFGARCTQGRVFSDMVFRDEVSEDCLYLNVWTPAKGAGDKLPVMVWIYGGGFQAGSASEPRQDGERLAQKGVVVVSMNYRLGVFGFLSHPELTKESPVKASGNYGLLDQVAALRWVKANIAAFGGDPSNVTIFGESAGSFSVSALAGSPLTAGLVHKAIGQSGAFFPVEGGGLTAQALAASEQGGVAFGKSLGAESLAALRALPAEKLLEAALKGGQTLRFAPNVDGHLLPADLATIHAAGKQHRIPLLAGWNADEIRVSVVLAPARPTPASFAEQARTRFGTHADAVLKAYAHGTDEDAFESAASLAGDTFIGYSTWKWLEMHRATASAPVYRYSFDRDIPIPPDHKVMGRAVTAKDIGARHAGEIEYVFGMLDTVKDVTWEPADRTLSEAMMTYWSNFAKTGNPNGGGVPQWPAYTAAAGNPVLHLDTTVRVAKDAHRDRYVALDGFATAPKP